MATTLLPPKPKSVRPGSGAGGGGRFRDLNRWGGGGGSDGWDPNAAIQRYKLGMWIGIGGIVMLFAAFTSAMVVRRGTGEDWTAFELPHLLWISTGLLLASSFSIETARRAMWRKQKTELRQWISVTAVLGLGFVGCQLAAWKQLAGSGIYLASNPSSSFFYLLTAAHGVHVLGGIATLGYVSLRVWRSAYWPTREAAVEAMTLYWHFMDGLWVYLLLLLVFWR